MQKDFLTSLELKSKEFAKKNNIFDIILYGSFVRGKEDYKDIDILVVFFDLPLNQRLEVSQRFKGILKKNIKNLDVKNVNLLELYDYNFLARNGILTEGYSLIKKTQFAKRMGFTGMVLFRYNLKNLNHNEKTKFTYSLIGRNDEGIIKKTKSSPIGKGAILVPIENSSLFEDYLKKWRINFEKKNILI